MQLLVYSECNSRPLCRTKPSALETLMSLCGSISKGLTKAAWVNAKGIAIL